VRPGLTARGPVPPLLLPCAAVGGPRPRSAGHGLASLTVGLPARRRCDCFCSSAGSRRAIAVATPRSRRSPTPRYPFVTFPITRTKSTARSRSRLAASTPRLSLRRHRNGADPVTRVPERTIAFAPAGVATKRCDRASAIPRIRSRARGEMQPAHRLHQQRSPIPLGGACDLSADSLALPTPRGNRSFRRSLLRAHQAGGSTSGSGS
jgi:hypothetical protein